MAAIKLEKFLGTAPKIAEELLPAGAAQTAYNVQLYSGNLIPYTEPTVIDRVPRLGVIKTLYGLRHPTTNVLSFLSWANDVDIVTFSQSTDADYGEQRYYYTGDGVPKVSDYSLSTAGSEPYPATTGYYELGLPLPTATIVAAARSVTSPTSTHFERDSGNTAIITTSAAHNLRTGNVVTIRGFSGSPASDFNVTNIQITVTSSTTFEYYNSGSTQGSTANTDGVVDLAGGTVRRQYVHTWLTPWDEESIASDPSDDIYIKEGQSTTITGLPTARPSGYNFIRGMGLYRTLTSASGTEFYKLSNLWFPLTLSKVARASNVVTITTSDHHNLIKDDKFKIAKCSDATFNIVGGVVTEVISDTQFTFAQTAGDVTEKNETAGTLYLNIAELADDTPRYWGDDSITTTHRTRSSNVSTLTTASAHGLVTGQAVTISGLGGSDYNASDVVITVTSTTAFTYANTGSDEGSTADTNGVVTNDSFLDDFDFLNLVDLLITDEYDAPKSTMTGLTLAQNNMVAGFFENQLCFAEPNKPWAWPLSYRTTFESDIVAIASVGGFLLVLTDEFAYRVSGNDPATLSITKIDKAYPCLSKRSVVNMGYGVLYATYGGLAMWTPRTGLALATQYIHDWDTWEEEVDPTTIVGVFHNDKYFGAHSTGSFIFEMDQKVGGYYTTAGHKFNSAWLDLSTNALYTVSDDLGNVTEWGSSAWPIRPMEWKSQAIVTKDYINIGAARVVADYTVTAEDTAAYATFNASVATYNTSIWADSQQLGALNGPTDYTDSEGVEVNNFAEFNRNIIHADGLTRTSRTVPSNYTVEFKLFQNKQEVLTRTLSDSNIFRCPVGYKADTFEVTVAGRARVRAIHLGETPDGLRKA
tara:strand:+ start:2340 stop:4946 length:2607 start_codon:yes stop_codon:yes gene_type:complete